jgi:predicted AAA+ superfamily ATPase
MRTPIVKVMVGHRRVVKSYILYQLIELILEAEKDANIIYINKEDIDFLDVISYKELYKYISDRLVEDKMNYIFIDDIQKIADFRIAIRSLALDDNNDIYIAGSNSDIFSGYLANEMGGRYIEFLCR